MKHLRVAFVLLALSASGCGKEAAPAPPAPPPAVPASTTSPAPAASPAPASIPAPAPRQDDIFPLRLSVLQARVPTGTIFYLHDPRLDPEGKLGERAHPLRDVYRPSGTYQMRFSRKGYRPVDVTVKLSAKGPEPALETLPLTFEAAEELSGPYREAEEALKAGDSKKARAALEKVRELDEKYLRTPQLLLLLAALEETQENERKALAEATARLRKGDLESAGKVEALRPKVLEVVAVRSAFDKAVGEFNLAGSEAELAKLRETLTPEDPSNRDRASRLDDLKSMRGLLDQYEQICREPRGARERLADLWERDRMSRADELAQGLDRFSRYAKVVVVAHKPTAVARRDNVAEVRATLTATYALPAGETTSEEKILVTFRKTDSWRFADYREVK